MKKRQVIVILDRSPEIECPTVKDAYSLPCIEESLDCLNGACIFTSLDLKSGYWQALVDEDAFH